MLVRTFLLAVLIPCFCVSVIIHRDKTDTMYNLKECMDSRESGSVNCTCPSSYATVLSKRSKKSLCQTPAFVGCDYSEFKSRQAFLVSGGSFSVRISQGLRTRCRTIQQILIWNLTPTGKGVWLDVTYEVMEYFSIDLQRPSWDTYLTISKLNMNLWSGHVIKIKFGTKMCKNCLIAKAKGSVSYPVDINIFKSYFRRPPTVWPSSATVSSTISSTTRATTSTIPATVPITMPVSTALTKSTSPKKIMNRIKRITKVHPTTSVIPIHSDNNKIQNRSPSLTIALITGICIFIIISILLYIILCRRRFHRQEKFIEYQSELLGIGNALNNNTFVGHVSSQASSYSSPMSSQTAQTDEGDGLKERIYDDLGKDINTYECIFPRNDICGERICSHEYEEISNEDSSEHSNVKKENYADKEIVRRVRATDASQKVDDGVDEDSKLIPHYGECGVPHEYAELCAESYESLNRFNNSASVEPAKYEEVCVGERKSSKDTEMDTSRSSPENFLQYNSPRKYGNACEAEVDKKSLKHFDINSYLNDNVPTRDHQSDIPHLYAELCPEDYEPLLLSNADIRNSSTNILSRQHGQCSSPHKYEQICTENYEPSNDRQYLKAITALDELSNSSCDSVEENNKNSVIKSVPNEFWDKSNNNSQYQDDNEASSFSNPFYLERLMISPQPSEVDEEVIVPKTEILELTEKSIFPHYVNSPIKEVREHEYDDPEDPERNYAYI